MSLYFIFVSSSLPLPPFPLLHSPLLPPSPPPPATFPLPSPPLLAPPLLSLSLPGLSLDPGGDVEVTVVDLGSPLPVSLNTKLLDAAQPVTKTQKKKKKSADVEVTERCLSPLEVRMSIVLCTCVYCWRWTQWNLCIVDTFGTQLAVLYTVEPLYRGHHWDPAGCPVYSGTSL